MILRVGSPSVIFLLLLVAVVLVLRHGSSQPTDTTSHDNDHDDGASTRVSPTPYPMAFRIQFDTNITRQKDGDPIIDPSSIAEENKPLLRSTLYYDWTLQAQRIDHPPGSYECVRFYNVSQTAGCQLYFTAVGMYRVITKEGSVADADHDCCLDLPGLGAPPPDWARRAHPTFRGLVRDAYSGYVAYEFVFDQDPRFAYHRQPYNTTMARHHPEPHDDIDSIYDQFHTAREVHDLHNNNGRPLSFTFPGKAMGRQDFHFDPTSLVIGRQDPEVLRLPPGCEERRCPASRQYGDDWEQVL